MKILRALLRFLSPFTAALATACLAGCYAYHPGGYYGGPAGAAPSDGDGKGTQPAEESSPPPVAYAPRPYYYPSYYPYYYPVYFGYGYGPRYYYPRGYYGRYYGGRGGYYHGGGHYYGRR